MRNFRLPLRLVFFSALSTISLLGLVLLLTGPIGSSPAAPPTTPPVAGLRNNSPNVHALVGAKIVTAPGQVIEKGVIVVREGVIQAVGAKITVPKDARIWDLSGKTIYPGLIDAYTEISIGSSDTKTSSPYWNSQIRPNVSAADAFKTDQGLNAKFRSQGITARLVAPKGGIIKGSSALVSTSDEKNAQTILKGDIAQHMRLTVPRSNNRDDYPNSPMGAVALARQALYDATWHKQAWDAHRKNGALSRPEQNDALKVLHPYLKSDRLVIIDALNELYFMRADRFAREFSLNIAIRGSGDEYRRLDAIRKTGRTVIVPLNFPKPPNVGTAEAAMSVTLESMLDWDLAPENPARLDQAGVRIALCSYGLKDQKEFLSAVRKAVKRGLSPEAALRAMTITPAELFGAANQLGTIEAGKAANLVVTDGDLFEKKTKVLETWADGTRYEIEKEPRFDSRGDWLVSLTDRDGNPLSLVIQLEGKTTKLSGSVRAEKKDSEEKDTVKLSHVGLRDARFSCTFEGEKFGQKGTVRLTAIISAAEPASATWLGYLIWSDGQRSELSAKRTARFNPDDDKEDDKENNNEKPAKDGDSGEDKAEQADKKKADEDDQEKDPQASFAVNYPLGAFGRSGQPKQSKMVLFRGATVWTCGKAGVLKNASVLIGGGKVLAVGTDIKPPEGAIVVDATGKHITPGLIDCHSHMATDGGINESTQAVTAEVRIGDFIDPNDINIYRQLAGGLTSSNILHGSANPIGGQNQVIKLRWGALGEQMKFAAAPQGIKFALGENVKQSNWGEEYTTRYPQSRMGVEQIVRDEFQAARLYQKQWSNWDKNHKGIPPRRDLELDAIAEILEGSRWIHCHSYRQDEILALIRTLDDFQVQIGTFQHILEGYKVADAMAKHGAMGSAFSDWWAYKFEVYDAIPYNGSLMHNAGVVVSFNSDDRELARHLNHEAAKAVKYGGVTPIEALKFVTLNPAKQLRIDKLVGSLEIGKHADLVVWSAPPLSTFSRCEQTWIDGRKYFDRDEDKTNRKRTREMKNELVQKILSSGQQMKKEGEKDDKETDLWPRENIYCKQHGFGRQ